MTTTFYELTEDQLKDYYNDNPNIVVKYLVENLGFDAFDLSMMYGSALVDDILYICVTDGRSIEVAGEEIDPEDALDTFTIAELEDYVEPATADIIKRYVSEYELRTPDMDEVGLELLSAGHHFSEIAQCAADQDWLTIV